jgi:hypothetical protein
MFGSFRPIGVGTGVGRSRGGAVGRGAGKVTRGGAGGAVATGVVVVGVVVVVVGAGGAGTGFDEAPGCPGGGSGVVLEAGGGVPEPGRLKGTAVVAATGVCFVPGELGLRRE